MTQAIYQGSPLQNGLSGSAPLVTLFERDDSIAVPLLSQLRMAGYDVRASRTPVELFDTLSKSLVSLVLVDLGAATAGRREFWVALDAQRRGRAIQVMTFRVISPHGDLDLDTEPSARAIPDVEAHGVHEFHRIIDGVRQRIPLHGAPAAPGFGQPGFAPVGAPGFPGMMSGNFGAPGAIQPLGAALGMAPTPFATQNAHVFNAPAASPAGWGGIAPLGVSPLEQPVTPFPPSPSQAAYSGYDPMGPMSPLPPYDSQFGAGMRPSPFDRHAPFSVPLSNPNDSGNNTPGSSPFANPTPANPFGPNSSPFAQPYQSNPFGGQSAPLSSAPLPPNTPLPPASQPTQPGQPGAQPISLPPMPSTWSAPPGPVSQYGQAPSGPTPFPQSNPGLSGAFPLGGPASVPPWLGDDRFAASPISFDSTPRVQNPGLDATPTPPPYQAPTFQDAWSPPTSDDAPTGVVPEVVFQKSAVMQRAPQPSPAAPTLPTEPPLSPARNFSASTWETNHEPAALAASAQPTSPAQEYIPPRSQLGPDVDKAPTTPDFVATPTEMTLGNVLVDGALLTPDKLEMLKGVQAMLAGVNVHRKLGDLALMFKFLSSDQLLAALLVSRGLVSPQQIASLGRVKQELAAQGLDNDLESLLVSFHILSAEKVSAVRAELAAAAK